MKKQVRKVADKIEDNKLSPLSSRPQKQILKKHVQKVADKTKLGHSKKNHLNMLLKF